MQPALTIALAALLGVSVDASVGGSDVRVVDQHAAAIVGARLTIACAQSGHVIEATSDGEGRAALPDLDGCRLTIEAAGFSTWQGSIADARRLGLVQLSIAPIKQQIAVQGTRPRSSWMPLGSARLRREDLALAGLDPGSALQYAKARAGAMLQGQRLYVDGLPASVIPSSAAIEELSINADPFSVLYSESDENVIDIVSATPDRTFRWSGGWVPGKVGGRNPLASDMSVERRLFNLSLLGPIRWTPLTFSLDISGSAFRDERPVVLSPDGRPDRGLTESSGYNLSAGLVGRWTDRLRTRLSLVSSRGDADGVNAGGFVRTEASMGNTLASADVRFTVDATGTRYQYRSGLLYAFVDSRFSAESADVGLRVLDAVTAGGAPVADMRTERRNWLWNNTVTGIDSTWLAGWAVSEERNQEDLEPNAHGQWLFGTPAEYDAALQGAQTGTLVRMVGHGRQTLSSITGAVFGQKEWRVFPDAIVRAGSRVDYQSGDGIALSPRLSAQARFGTLEFQSGVGVFRQNWSTDVLMQANRFGRGDSEWQIADAWLQSPGNPLAISRVRTQIDADVARPRSVVISNGVERRGARLAYGVEHRWTAGVGRLGSRRLASVDGWLDRLDSSRRLRRHQVHSRVEYSVARTTLLGHYEWVRSRDDTDGPFSFPERQNDVAAEWARSTGVAPHNVSIVVNPPPVRAISFGVVFAARSRSPQATLSGLDIEGTHLYADRAGLPRNAGRGPGFASLDAYAHRRVAIPFIRYRGGPIFVDAALTAENLLGSANYGSVGLILASPFFGQPVTALPGRTVRCSLRLAR